MIFLPLLIPLKTHGVSDQHIYVLEGVIIPPRCIAVLGPNKAYLCYY